MCSLLWRAEPLPPDRAPYLENLAAKRRRRASDVAMERAHEVREVLEPHLERDVGDWQIRFHEALNGAADPRPDQVLVRCQPQLAPEQAEEVERAELDAAGDGGEIQRLLPVRFQ